MTDASIEAAKAGLRQQASKRRAALGQDFRSFAARTAAGHFFAEVALPHGAIVAAYWPIRDELDCKPVLTRLVDSGQPVCLPIVTGDDQPLTMRLWAQAAPLYASGFGSLAPGDDAPIVEPDVIIMPLLGFDTSGTRLGYGGGYYDRTLALMTRRPQLIGYAFAAQQLPSIPHEPHDIPLDMVVTEDGIVRFNEGKSA
jgi:5-formyltetrahydrofolate cyclo-ligase